MELLLLDGGEFCNGLRPYRTNEEALKNNTFDVLSGDFDEYNIKRSEVPFYNSIKSNPQPIETISEEIPFTEFKRFWSTMKSGNHPACQTAILALTKR